jgi:ParB-like chromosome segregation protein Spo0J
MLLTAANNFLAARGDFEVGPPLRSGDPAKRATRASIDRHYITSDDQYHLDQQIEPLARACATRFGTGDSETGENVEHFRGDRFRGGSDEAPIVRSVPIASLRIECRYRSGLNLEHIAALTECDVSLPPILVAKWDLTVIDGAHRVEAARRQGRDEIDCELFEGSERDAFVESIRRNAQHGMPLTLDERRRAAARILCSHPEWSDRMIGATCALSRGAVGRIRAAKEQDHAESRIGLDGRARPRDRETMRRRVVDALEADPNASLRALAMRTGTSPETVRRVKREQLGGLRKDEESRADLEPMALPSLRLVKAGFSASADVTFTSTAPGAHFAEWFDRTGVDMASCERARDVPLSKVYEVADEARRRSAIWSDFARLVERRASANARVARS